MNNLINWFRLYSTEITWWVIGWLSFALIDSIVRENWVTAIVDALLIYLNYKLWKNNNA